MPQNPPSQELPEPAPEFPPFSVAQLLKEGTLLLASSGKEYAEPIALGTPAEVARARKEAMNRLGLGFIDGVGDDELELGKELSQSQNEAGAMDVDLPSADVKPSITARANSPAVTFGDATSSASSPALSTSDIRPRKILKIKTEVQDPSDSAPESPGPSGDGLGLSARERNRLKRKLKTGNSAFIASPSTAKSNPAPPPAPPPNK
jgi:TATA-binding protein-associated factor